MTNRLSHSAIAVLASTFSLAHGGPVLPQRTPPLHQHPLNLPILRSGEPCPTSTGGRETVPRQPHIFGTELSWFGNGPVFVALAWKDSPDDNASFSLERVPRHGIGYRAKTPWVSDPSYSGPILIRGHALDATERALQFSASAADRSPGLHLMAPNAPTASLWSFWPSSMWVPGPGCYGVQIDTLSGTDVVVFQAT
jgi:hypothetical protein